jgi:hypothetical protein
MNQQEFLDDIENDLYHIVDSYYGELVLPIMDKIKNYLNDPTWNLVRRLPTPGIPLKLRLDTGEIIDGVRPSYIASYKDDDLGYRTADGVKILNVVEWSIA